MCGDKINRDIVAFTVVDQLGNPLRLGCSGSADTQPGINTFNSKGRLPVEFPVLRNGSRPEPVEIRLIPDLEVPLAYFSKPVSLHAMPGKGLHELAPFREIFRRADIHLEVEDGLLPRGKGFRHRVQLDEGTDSQPEE